MTRVFVKGNGDVHASLVAEGRLREAVRRAHEPLDVEVLHQPSSRFDLILQQLDRSGVPPAVAELGDAFVAAQWSGALFESRPDVVVLSLEPDLAHEVFRHRSEGWLLAPPLGFERSWPAAKRRWLEERFEPLGRAGVEASMTSLLRLVAEIKARLEAHVVVFNASTVDPDDRTSNFRGVAETTPLRIHAFDRALMEVSVLEGISIVDVDRRIGELGAGRHVEGALRYSAEAQRALAEELARVLADIGFFEARPLVAQVGRRG